MLGKAVVGLLVIAVLWSDSLRAIVGNLLLQLGIPLLVLAQIHWVAQELYLHQP